MLKYYRLLQVDKTWANFKGNEVFIGIHRSNTTKFYKTDPTWNQILGGVCFITKSQLPTFWVLYGILVDFWSIIGQFQGTWGIFHWVAGKIQ
jgi:hypothetical protein